ncbi:MAG: DUF2335 domain-containing protein [Chloroflexota bacterium]
MSADPPDPQPRRRRSQPARHPAPTQERPIPPSLMVAAWEGMLPHPDDLARYDALVPGAARLIIEQARDQTAHRMAQEAAILQANIRYRDRALLCGAAVVLTALVAAVILGLAGVSGGYWTGIAAVLAAAATTLYGIRRTADTQAEKRRQARPRLPEGQ